MPQLTAVKVESMRKDRTAIKVNGDWYSSYGGKGLGGVEYGDNVTFEFTKKGRFNNIQGQVQVVEGSGGGASAASGDERPIIKSSGNAGVEVGHAWNSAVQIAMNTVDGPEAVIELAAELTPRVYSICAGLRDMAASGDLKMDNPFDFSAEGQASVEEVQAKADIMATVGDKEL